ADYSPTPITTSSTQHLDDKQAGSSASESRIYDVRRLQLETLRDFIHSCLNQYNYRETASLEAESLNAPADIALLVGDLNSDGITHSDGGLEHGWQLNLLKHVLESDLGSSAGTTTRGTAKLNLTDIFYSQHGTHPVTTLSLFHELPDNFKEPKDGWHPSAYTDASQPALTPPAPNPMEYKCLDYIFQLRWNIDSAATSAPYIDVISDASGTMTSVIPSNPRVNPFRISSADRVKFASLIGGTPLIHASDHAGLETDLVLK
ncbi:hypothetical protein HDU93_003878, partial [Gonapodya sp. JEL0774]